MDWIDLAQDRDKWRALMNMVMNVQKDLCSIQLVGLVTRLRAGLSGDGIPAGGKRFINSPNVETGCGAHPVSCSVDTGCSLPDVTAAESLG
jgi:hypothetical protein